MGRSAGFIAAHATLASGDVDLCLIPEVPIDLGVYLEGMLTQGGQGGCPAPWPRDCIGLLPTYYWICMGYNGSCLPLPPPG